MSKLLEELKSRITRYEPLAAAIIEKAEKEALIAARKQCGDDLSLINGIDPKAYVSFECVSEDEKLPDATRKESLDHIKRAGRKFIHEGRIADPVLRELTDRDIFFALDLDATDLDLAKRLVVAWHDRLRYSHALGGMHWTGNCWRFDEKEDAPINRAAQEIADRMTKETRVVRLVAESGLMPELLYFTTKKDANAARAAADFNQLIFSYEELSARARSAKSNSSMKAMVSLAIDHMIVEALDIDQQPNLLATAAGTVDLKTGEIRPNDPNDLITRMTPIHVANDGTRVRFDPAKAPVWLKAIDDAFLGDANLIDYVQRMVGYIITGETREQKFFFFYGSGSNMKGRFCKVLETLIPGHYTKVPVALMMKRHGNAKDFGGTNETIADLRGVRMIHFEESDADDVLDEGPMKALSGEGKFKAAKKWKSELLFSPVGKVVGEMNHHPKITSQDKAIWRRVVEIPFRAHFANPGDEGYEEGVSKPKDPSLPEKLEVEMPHILAWAIEGAVAYYGNRGLGDEPQAVIDAREAYKEEVDILRDFIESCCNTGPDLRAHNGDLYTAYENFMNLNAAGNVIKTSTFKSAMRERGFDSQKIGPAMWRMGIALNKAGKSYARGKRPQEAKPFHWTYGDNIIRAAKSIDDLPEPILRIVKAQWGGDTPPMNEPTMTNLGLFKRVG